MKVSAVTLIATIVGIVSIFISPYYAINPGVIAKGHEKLKQDCFACHTLTKGVEKLKCINCHDPKKIGIAKVDGSTKQNSKGNLLHQVVQKMECADCHKEHQGTPIETAKQVFSHRMLPVDLITACSSCHALAKPTDDIHADPTMQCGVCHSTEAWKPANYVNHSKYFLFDHNHPASCMNCHNPNESFKNYTCYKCHEHNEAKIISEHEEEGIRDIRNCVKCHRSSNKDDAEKEGRSSERREGGEHSEEDDH